MLHCIHLCSCCAVHQDILVSKVSNCNCGQPVPTPVSSAQSDCTAELADSRAVPLYLLINIAGLLLLFTELFVPVMPWSDSAYLYCVAWHADLEVHMWAGPQQCICVTTKHCSMTQHRRANEPIPGASCHAGLSPQCLQPGSWQPALPQHGGCYAPAAAVASSPGCRSPVQCVTSALLQHTVAMHACQMQSHGRVAQLKAGSSNC